MSIEVSCRTCGKEYRVREERAGTKIRCKECQSTITVQEAKFDEQDDGELDHIASWTQKEPRSSASGQRRSATKAEASASPTVRKLFGVLALLVAAMMCLGIGIQVVGGSLSSLGGFLVVGAVGSVGLKWLRT